MKEIVPLGKKSMTKDPKDSEVWMLEYTDKKNALFEKEIDMLYT